MTVRRQRFQQPSQPLGRPPVRVSIVEPVLGLNHKQPPTNLRPGETPFSQNWVVGDRFIEPRSGLSSWGTTGVTGTPLGFVVAPRSDRSEHAYILSSSTIRTYDINASVPHWAGQASAAALSTNTNAYYHTANGLRTQSSSTTGPSTIFMTNWSLTPKVMAVGQSLVNKVSDFTEVYSLLSYARYVVAFDQRMIFFHSGTTNAFVDFSYSVPDYSLYNSRRVTWSARGDTFNYAEGGFEDLVDMRGIGTGAIAEQDRLILLSQYEVWAGRPRRDAYAFDFFNIDKARGCPIEYDRTPANTEAGTLWLGEGFQFYRVVDNSVRAVGDKVRALLHEEMREHQQCWSLYNAAAHTYALFYSDTTGQYPTKALFLRTDTVTPVAQDRDDGVWLLQDFGDYQFVAGGVYGADTVLIRSNGSAYRLLSTQTSDDGVPVDARWRSHAMRADRDLFPFEVLQELWVESSYASTRTSTLSMFASIDNGATFAPVGSLSITSGDNYTCTPITAAGARNTMFELRLNDGTTPQIASIQAKLRGYSGRFGG